MICTTRFPLSFLYFVFPFQHWISNLFSLQRYNGFCNYFIDVVFPEFLMAFDTFSFILVCSTFHIWILKFFSSCLLFGWALIRVKLRNVFPNLIFLSCKFPSLPLTVFHVFSFSHDGQTDGSSTRSTFETFPTKYIILYSWGIDVYFRQVPLQHAISRVTRSLFIRDWDLLHSNSIHPTIDVWSFSPQISYNLFFNGSAVVSKPQ